MRCYGLADTVQRERREKNCSLGIYTYKLMYNPSKAAEVKAVGIFNVLVI